MPVLNEALGARLGATPVRRIYRGTEIICPGVVNLATNPSFETVAAGTTEVRRNEFLRPRGTHVGSAVTATHSSVPAPAGCPVSTTAIRCVVVGSGGQGTSYWTYSAGMLPLGTLTFSAWVYVDSTTGATGVKARVGAVGATGETGAVSNLLDTWHRVSVTFTLQSGQGPLPQFIVYGSAGATAYGTGFLLEATSELRPYFDGTYNPTAGTAVSWLGTADNSGSVMKAGVVEVYRNTHPNPAAVSAAYYSKWDGSAPGATTWAAATGATPNGSGTFMRLTFTASPATRSGGVIVSRTNAGLPAGVPVKVSTYVRSSIAQTVSVQTQHYVGISAATSAVLGNLTLPAGQWVRYETTVPLSGVEDSYQLRFYAQGGTTDSTIWPVGATFDITETLETATGAWFSGSTPLEVARNYSLYPQANNGWGINYGTGGAGTVATVSDARFQSRYARRVEWSVPGTGGWISVGSPTPIVAGDVFTLSARYASSEDIESISVVVGGGSAARTTVASGTIDNGDGTLTGWRTVSFTASGNLNGITIYMGAGRVSSAGRVLFASDGLITKTATRQEFFMPAIDAMATPAVPTQGGVVPVWAGIQNGSQSVATDPDLTPAWVGSVNASASVLRGVGVASVAPASVGPTVAFKSSGGVRILSKGTAAAGHALDLYGLPALAGKTVTFLATVRIMEALSGANTGSGPQRCFAALQGSWQFSPEVPNTPGTHVLRWTTTFAASPSVSPVRFMHGKEFGSVYLDDLVVAEGTYTGPYRDGRSPGWAWEGAADASASYGLN